MKSKKPEILNLGLAFGIAVLVYRLLDSEPSFDDFLVYYRAGTEAIAHRSVFQFPGHYQFKYSPFIALIFGETFSRFSVELVGKVFNLISAMLVCFWTVQLTRNKIWRNFRLSLPLIFIFLCAYSVALDVELRFGQVNLVPILCFGGVFSWLPSGRKFQLSSTKATLFLGLLGSLAIQTKLYAVIFLPSILFQKRFQLVWAVILWTFVLDGILMGAYHSFAFAWSENLSWFTSLTASSTELLLSKYDVSLLGCTEKLFGSHLLAIFLWSALCLFYLGICYSIRKRSPWRAFEIGGIMIPLLTPLSWPYWSFLCAPAFLRCAEKVIRRWRNSTIREKTFQIFFFLSYLFFTIRQDELSSLQYGLVLVEIFLLAMYCRLCVIFRKQALPAFFGKKLSLFLTS